MFGCLFIILDRICVTLMRHESLQESLQIVRCAES
jgi:hypothetical protein